MPVHTGFENHVASSPSSHQRAEILRTGVIDAASLQVAPLRIEHAIDAVCLVIIDTDERRHPCWLNWLPFHGDNLHHRVYAPCRPPSPQIKQPSGFHVALLPFWFLHCVHEQYRRAPALASNPASVHHAGACRHFRTHGFFRPELIERFWTRSSRPSLRQRGLLRSRGVAARSVSPLSDGRSQ